MHHVVVERWSRGSSPLHRRDARAKLGAVLALLIAIATTPAASQRAFTGYATLLAIAIAVGRLPWGPLLRRAALVLPFSATFAALAWLSGDSTRALALVEKSFLSGLAALVLVATTPLTELLGGLESMGAPRVLVLAIQFLYRYLFVISEQAQRMRQAARSRQGLGKSTGSRFRAASGALGVLFARSSERADGIYRAMLARRFTGRFSALTVVRFGSIDAALLGMALAAALAIRLAT